MTKYRKRYPRYSENYKLIRKFMKVVPDYLPKFNALIDSPVNADDFVHSFAEMKMHDNAD